MTDDTKQDIFEDLTGQSYLEAKTRFSRRNKSLEYPSEYGGNSRDKREVAGLTKAFEYVAPGVRVLDFPCGTGRLTKLLTKWGFQVRGADVSSDMVTQAKKNYHDFRIRSMNENAKLPSVQFDIEDIMRTTYGDGEFEAVVCNRLFHHFNESDIRLAALRELHRISAGPVIISFFNSLCFDAYWRRFRNFIRRKHPQDRLPISLRQFKSELNLTGFMMVSYIPVRPFVSPMCYVVACHKSR